MGDIRLETLDQEKTPKQQHQEETLFAVTETNIHNLCIYPYT